jgi:hypothetical protein
VAGAEAGVWCPYGEPADLPPDQRREDGLCLVFDGAPVEEPVDILGNPRLRLTVAADEPVALVAVRLCDVSPDGASLQVSKGVLNLTHRDGHEDPKPLEPDRWYDVEITLDAAGHRLLPGHHWRLALSPTYWPMAWPSPRPVTLSVQTGEGSCLFLPVRPPQPMDETLSAFPGPEQSRPVPHEVLRTPSIVRTLEEDVASKEMEIRHVSDRGSKRLTETDLEIGSRIEDHYSIVEGEPLSATVTCTGEIELTRGEWSVRAETYSRMTSDAEAFYLTHVLDAYEGQVRVFSKTWDRRIPRNLV